MKKFDVIYYFNLPKDIYHTKKVLQYLINTQFQIMKLCLVKLKLRFFYLEFRKIFISSIHNSLRYKFIVSYNNDLQKQLVYDQILINYNKY